MEIFNKTIAIIVRAAENLRVIIITKISIGMNCIITLVIGKTCNCANSMNKNKWAPNTQILFIILMGT